LFHSRIISLRIDLRLPEGCKCIYQTRLYLWAGNYRVYLSWQLTITTWFHRFLRIFRCDQSYIDTTYTGETYIANRTHRTVIMSPKPPQTYCICSVSYYYYYYSFFLSFFRQKFVRHISRRLLNGNQWNFTGMLSTMSRCADYFRNFQNGRRCHWNDQNAKKLKNTKMIIAGYSPNRNWSNLLGTTSTSIGTR
jgi:hypothetical protein